MKLHKISLFLLLGLFFISFASAVEINWSQAIAYYPLDGLTGLVNDSTGNVNTSHNNGATRGVQGKLWRGFQFDGGVGTNVNLTEVIFDSPEQLNTSFNFWYNLDGIADVDDFGMFGFGSIIGSYIEFGTEDTFDSYELRIGAVHTGPNLALQCNTNASSIITDSWTMMSVVKDIYEVRIYQNANLIQTCNSTLPLYFPNGFASGGRTRLGDGVFYINDNYNGTMDEFSIWNTSLSQDDLTTLYNNNIGLGYNASVFRINETYSETILEGDIGGFELFFGISNSSVNPIFGTLDYGGEITYLVPANFGNGVYRMNHDQISKSVSVDTNVTFNWSVTLSDGLTHVFSNQDQLVQIFSIDDCSVNTLELFNVSLFDERLLSPINGTIEADLTVFSDDFNPVLQSSFNASNVHTVNYCSNILLNSTELLFDLELRYYSSPDGGATYNYVPELYNIQKAISSSLPQNISLYDLNINESTKFLIKYQGDDLVAVEGAVVQLLRKYVSEGLSRTVEAPLTSNIGSAVVHIDLNSNVYKAIVVKDGQILDIFDNLVFDCESELTGTCTQNLFGELDSQNTISVGVLNDFSYVITEVNNTITSTFTIPSGLVSSVNIVMSQEDAFGNTSMCNTTISSNAGSIDCTYSESLSDSIISLKMFKDGELLVQKGYFVAEASSVDWDGANFFIVLIFLFSLVGMAFVSPEWVIGMGVVAFVLSGGIWLLNGLNFVVGLGGLLWLIVVAGILIYKISRQTS